MYVLGIDPGLSGAIAAVNLENDIHIHICSLPTVQIKVGKKVRNRMNLHETWATVQAFAAGTPDLVVLEEAGVRPQQAGGVAFGRVAGALEAFVVAAAMPINLVAAATWKRALKIPADKDAARQAASRLFPRWVHLWARAKDDGGAEAALLAWYGATRVLGWVPR